MPRSGAVTLSDLIDPTLTVACARCQRKGRYSVARLMSKHGDARLTDLRTFLTADCPQRARKSIDARCQALFDPLPETKRERQTHDGRSALTPQVWEKPNPLGVGKSFRMR
jgi:hypothetical protein